MMNQPISRPEPARAHWGAFIAAWCGWVLDAFDFTVYLLVMKQIATEFNVGIAAVSGSITLTLLLRLGGASVAGWMADRWGRKLPLMLSLVWFAVFDAAIYFAPSFMWILVLRTVFGFGMGAEWTAGTALAMESLPPHRRKLASGILQAGWPVGFLLAAATAYFVVPAFGWRAMFLVAVVPALLVFPIRFLVRDEAPPPKAATAAKQSAFGELLAPGVLRMIVIGSCVMALGFIVYYGLTSQYSLMLMGELHLAPQTAFLHVILFNVGMLVGVIAAGFVASRWGVIAALVTPALLMVPALPLYVGWVHGMLGVGAFLGGALGVGYSGVTPVLTTSLFPAHIRARAIGVVYHVGALIAAFVPWLVAATSERTGIPLSTVIASVVGVGLVAMSTAVFALRRDIAPVSTETAPSTWTPSPHRGGDDELAALDAHAVDPSLRGERRERGVELAN
jgi:SHS family lactate transporter-like MFS transporter